MKVFSLLILLFNFSSLSGQFDYVLPIDFPNFNFVENYSHIDDDKIFLSSYSMSPLHDRNYLIVLSSAGELVFFKKMNMPTMDFKVQKNGLLSFLSPSYPNWNWRAFTMDESYTIVDSFEVSDPYSTDSHDFLLLESGNYIMLGSHYQYLDMTDYGGPEVARIEGCIIQEFNQNKELVFEWSSFDHFEFDDILHRSLNAPQIDYVHANSIEVDNDGNLLLSSRHLCEITKINRSNGQIIWRLGGKNNQFTFDEQFYNNHSIPTPFCSQHDVRVLENGNITFFDNGNDKLPKYSRVVEYVIDEINKTAELAEEFRDTINYSGFLGNAQKLNNGNVMSVWNTQGAISTLIREIKPDHNIAMQIELPLVVDSDNKKVGDFNYRAFKFNWQGKQVRPFLWSDTLDGNFNLNFIQFGDDSIEMYYIYIGQNLFPLEKIDSTINTRYSFENLLFGIEQSFVVSSKNNLLTESEFSNSISFTSHKLYYGDVNYDAKIDLLDFYYISDMINGYFPLKSTADFNQDSFVNVLDIESIILFLTTL